MTTVVNNPAPQDPGGGMGFLLGIILLIVFVIVLLYFGLPYLRMARSGDINVQLPDKVDINVQNQQY